MSKAENVMIAFLIAILVVGFYVIFDEEEYDVFEEYHIHADFRVFLNGTAFDFSQEKFMSTPDRPLSNWVHLHDNDGDVMHFHAAEFSVGYFFQRLGMVFNDSCFITDDGTAYCNHGPYKVRMYVNDTENFELGDYIPSDTDRLLITFGETDDYNIEVQRENVTDNACIQSQLCPWRGEAYDEATCLTGGKCIAE